jgi:hypothetical protein
MNHIFAMWNQDWIGGTLLPILHRNTTSFFKDVAMTMISFALPLASAVACIALRLYLAVSGADEAAQQDGYRGRVEF